MAKTKAGVIKIDKKYVPDDSLDPELVRRILAMHAITFSIKEVEAILKKCSKAEINEIDALLDAISNFLYEKE